MAIPTISVVMSVYNGARFLHEAMESILDQTFTDFEFIIIDDGSTDNTKAILDSYREKDARVRIYSQENQGLTDALNRGCALARGRYIARMDADDISVRERFMWQLEFMEAHPEVGVLGGAFELIDTKDRRIGVAALPVEDADIRRFLVDSTAFLHPAVLMRKAAIDEVGGYRKVMYAEDYDLWLRMAEQVGLANLPRILHKYRLHPDQVSVSKCREQALWTGAAQVAALFRKNGKPDPLDSIAEMTPAVLAGLGMPETTQQTNMARGYLRCIRNLYRSGEYALAIEAMEALRSGEFEKADRWVIADCYLWAAKLYWRERRLVNCALSALRAFITRPVILGRPLKSLLMWFQAVCQLNVRTPERSHVAV